MAFDPDSAGGVPFDPDTAGGVAPAPVTSNSTKQDGSPSDWASQLWAGAREGITGGIKAIGDATQYHGDDPAMIKLLSHTQYNGGGRPSTAEGAAAIMSAIHGPDVPQSSDKVVQIARRLTGAATGGLLFGPEAVIPSVVGAGTGMVARAVAPPGYEDAAEKAGNLIGGGLTALKTGAGAGKGESEHVVTPDTTLNPDMVAQQASVARANARVAELMKPGSAYDTTGKGLDIATANNVAKTETMATIDGLRKKMSDLGYFDNDPGMNSDLKTLAQAANAHTNSVPPSLLARVDDLPPAADAIKQPLKDALLDLNNHSTSAVRNNAVGPVQTVLSHAAGLSHLPFAKPTGAMVGRAIDSMLGLKKTPLQSALPTAQAILNRAGVDPTQLPPSQPALQAASGALQPIPGPAAAPVGPYGATVAKPPPFIGPAVTAPTGPLGSPYGLPGTTPPATALARAQQALAQREADAAPTAPVESPYGPASKTPPATALANAQRLLAQREAAAAPAIDPDTGNPADPIPVNTPIKAGKKSPTASQSAAPPLPAFRPATSSDVMNALAADKDLPAAPSAPVDPSPGITYVAQGLNTTRAGAEAAMRSAEAAGKLEPGYTDRMLTNPAGIQDAHAQVIYNHVLDQAGQSVGVPPANQGYAVEHSVQALTNATNYQNNARALAAADPANAHAILDIAQSGKGPVEKAVIAAKHGYQAPEWLINHGNKAR